MALIETVKVNDAQGIIKDGYKMFMENVGIVPKPMEMMSVSPALFEMGLKRIEYYSNHPKLSFPLLAHIRYLAAHSLDYGFCMDFNKEVLKKLGVEEDQFKEMETDPSKSMLEKHDSAMLSFVVKSIKSPNSVTEGDIKALKDLGWEDLDMVDALSQGVSMIDHSIMMQVFQMDPNCLI
ncbi:MAG: hypothetical protein GY714_08700 [Desulfobacterales bacterium]|nr:hypothetical protein [Desulfobacterales bacterium]MCP4163818.1 hypothetical protein [Deltaproteobacteria bacterium]